MIDGKDDLTTLEQTCFDKLCQNEARGISCWTLPDFRYTMLLQLLQTLPTKLPLKISICLCWHAFSSCQHEFGQFRHWCPCKQNLFQLPAWTDDVQGFPIWLDEAASAAGLAMACRPAMIMKSSQIKLDGVSQEAQMVARHWKQQHGYDLAQDGSCLLEIQLSEDFDEPYQLMPQACVSLSSSLNPASHGMHQQDLRAELLKTAGMLKSSEVLMASSATLIGSLSC